MTERSSYPIDFEVPVDDEYRSRGLAALGVILFELLTRELPFRGNMRMIIQQVIHDEPPSPKTLNSFVPKDLETICLKCLEKDPQKRYQSGRDLSKIYIVFSITSPSMPDRSLGGNAPSAGVAAIQKSPG